MNGINGTSSGLSTSTVNNLRGYGGLASGLDRDTLINDLTYGTQLKIAQQEQKKQLLEWEQEAIRNLTGKLHEFTTKFTSFTSGSNLLGENLFLASDITANGENNKYVSVSGSGTAIEGLSILGVQQLAESAKLITNTPVSDQSLSTVEMNNSLSTTTEKNLIEGTSLYFTYGDTRYTVELKSGEGYSYNTIDEVAASINKAMENVELETGDTLAEAIKFTVDGDRLNIENTDVNGNKILLSGGTGELLENLGFLEAGTSIYDLEEEDKTIGEGGFRASNNIEISETVTYAEVLSESQIYFEYNGKGEWIKLGEFEATGTMADVQADLQNKLNSAFGKNRITVDLADDGAGLSSLSFRTTVPSISGGVVTVNDDPTSIIEIKEATRGILEESGIFGIQRGDSNRLNISAMLTEAGSARGAAIDTTQALTFGNSEDGTVMDLSELGLGWDSSVEDIIDKINESEEFGIRIIYQENTDKFVVESKEEGVTGELNISGTLADVLFGSSAEYNIQSGQDAILNVKYDGTNEVVTLTRGSNIFSMDGIDVTLKGEFGYDEAGNYIETTEAITFNAEVDTEATTEVVREMVDEYNEILELLYDELKEKPDSDYAPLTDEQRDELTESQIEKWETEAQKGVLFADTDIRALTDALRFVLPAGMYDEFKEIGLSVSTDYTDNGKLIFDEAQFKTALAENPEEVSKLFNGSGELLENGERETLGLITSMKTVMDRYASMTGSTKGLLVERAGSEFAPTTIIDNTIQNELDDIDSIIDRFIDSLESEQDRYIQQFTALETLIAEMNSQSSYLSQMFTY